MQQISIKAMLESGAHFGHQTRRWNPKMAKYIYGSRNNIHIIDLQKSVKELKRALRFVEELTLRGGKLLFVGTKRQAQEAVTSEAVRCGAFYAATRWVGGTLTNFAVVRKSIDRMLEMEKMIDSGILDVLNKKEGRKFQRELNAFHLKYQGLKTMTKMPDAVFVVDSTEEVTVIVEARRMGIPIIAICDTNADPDPIDYPIPGNDDALRAIRFFTQAVAQAMIDAQARIKSSQEEKMETQAIESNDQSSVATTPQPAESSPKDSALPSPAREAGTPARSQSEGVAVPESQEGSQVSPTP